MKTPLKSLFRGLVRTRTVPTLIEPERPAPMPSPPPATPWGLLARRPLFDSRGALAGWDIELSAAARARATVTRVSAVRLSYGAALSAAATEVIADGRHALLAPPAELLAEAEFIASLPLNSWLRLGPVELAMLGAQASPQIAAWRTRGLRVATPPGLVPGDLNLLDARGGAARLPATSCRGWVAINLGSLDALAASIASGFALCCGRFDAIPRPPRTARLADHAAGAARMLSALLAGGSARQLAEIAHTDVALSWRLLRLARSARFGRAAASLSAQQAIQLLGTRELYRWLSALMISARPDAPLAAGLQEQALARGRLLELLAARVGHAPPELLFIVGSFSLLEALLAVPLEVALVAVPLPAAANDALIAHEGPWWPYLAAALAVERNEAGGIEAACLALGITPETLADTAAEAARWAASAAAALPLTQAP